MSGRQAWRETQHHPSVSRQMEALEMQDKGEQEVKEESLKAEAEEQGRREPDYGVI